MTKVLFNSNQRMICGQSNAMSRKYHLYKGKSGNRWLVADQPNAGDNVYVEGSPNSDGFGGAILTFDLVLGGKLELKGPWHSNSDALFADTGIDVRNKFLTFGIVAQKRENGPKGMLFNWYYDDIIHRDEEPTIGHYDRIERIANAWTKEHGKTCFYQFLTQGGGSAGSTRLEKK